MKHLSLCVVLALTLALLLTACGDKPQNETTLPTQPTQQTTPVTAPATLPPETVPVTTLPTEPAHEHTPTVYEYDCWDHWYVCDCGKTVYEVHKQDPDGRCTVCGITVQKYTNGYYSGYYDILIYDDHGTLISETNYDNEGNVIGWKTTEVTYYSDGNLKHSLTLDDDGWIYEVYYTHRENGEGVRCDYRIFRDPYNGAYDVHIWDELENIIQINHYTPDGILRSVEDRIYEYAPDGGSVHLTCIVDGVISEVRDYLIAADGTWLMTYFAQYQDGKIDYVNIMEYDEGGNIIHQEFIVYDEDGNPIERQE